MHLTPKYLGDPSPYSAGGRALTPVVTHSCLPIPHAIGATLPHRRAPQGEAVLTLEAQVATHGVGRQPRAEHAILKGDWSWAANTWRERRGGEYGDGWKTPGLGLEAWESPTSGPNIGLLRVKLLLVAAG